MTDPDATPFTLTQEADRDRYAAYHGEYLAGIAEYTLDDGVLTLTHTETKPGFEGRGVASTLARFVLDDVRARGGLRVVPKCSFMQGWIDKHPEYEDLL